MTFARITSSLSSHISRCHHRRLTSFSVDRQARGDDGHNLVTIVMHQYKTDLHGALEWISRLHDDLADTFLEAFQNMPSWGVPSLDAQVAIYVDGLGNWVRGNDTWSFEVRDRADRMGMLAHQLLFYRVNDISGRAVLKYRGIEWLDSYRSDPYRPHKLVDLSFCVDSAIPMITPYCIESVLLRVK